MPLIASTAARCAASRNRADPIIRMLGEELVPPRSRGAAIIFMAGGHVIRAGVARHLVDLMERGLLTHLALNGSGPIHDWELALIGATCESVPRYVRSGEFGLWRETGRMNDVIASGYAAGLGYGERSERRFWRGFSEQAPERSRPGVSTESSRSRFISASGTTFCTNTPIATARRWGGPAIATFSSIARASRISKKE